jgi:hypothetical protein
MAQTQSQSHSQANQTFRRTHLDPDLFVPGRPDDFDGRLVRLVYGIDKWGGQTDRSDHYGFFLVGTWDIDDIGEYSERLIAGNLGIDVPSKDGANPCGFSDPQEALAFYRALAKGDEEIGDDDKEKFQGVYALSTKGELTQGTDAQQFFKALKDLGVEFGPDDSLEALWGIEGHWARCRKTDAKGQEKPPGKNGQVYTVLCATAVHGRASNSSKTGGKIGAGAGAKGKSGAGVAGAAGAVAGASNKPNGSGGGEDTEIEEIKTAIANALATKGVESTDQEDAYLGLKQLAFKDIGRFVGESHPPGTGRAKRVGIYQRNKLQILSAGNDEGLWVFVEPNSESKEMGRVIAVE